MDESGDVSVPGSDAELLNAIRSGEPGAFDQLRARHEAAARRLVGLLSSEPAAADAIADRALAQVLDAISRGGGPTDAFRPYLLTAVRRAALAAGGPEGSAAPVPTDAQRLPDPGQRLIDPAAVQAAASPVAAAFESLPERWRAVLWHTQIELAPPAEVAPLLGLTAAEVTELAGRALDGLARALPHPQQAADPGGDHRTAAAGRADRETAGPGELADAGAALRRTVAPVVLGAAAAAYLPARPGSPDPTPPGAGRAAKPVLAAGAAGRWLAGKAHGSTPQQRTIAAGAATLLVVLAAGGYVLSLSPGGGANDAASRRPVAGGAPDPAGLTSSAAARPTTPAPAVSRPAPPTTAPPRPAPPTAAPPTTAPASSAPPVTTPPGQHLPPGPGPGRPHPSPSPSAAPLPGQAPGAQLTAVVSVFGLVGLSRAAAVSFGVTDAGPVATGDLTVTFSLPSGTVLGPGWDGPSGWSCQPAGQPAGRGAACEHAPIGAAAGTGGILTVLITGPAACGQPVSIAVSGGQSAAEAQSGTIRCGQPQSFGALVGWTPGAAGTGGAGSGVPLKPAPAARSRTAAGTPGRAAGPAHRARAGVRSGPGRGSRAELAGARHQHAAWPGSPWAGRTRAGGRRPGPTWPAGDWPRRHWPGTWSAGHGPTWPGASWPPTRPPGK